MIYFKKITTCRQCGGECRAVPELLNYTGTNRAYGRVGICTGEYVSNCCLEAVRQSKLISLRGRVNETNRLRTR